MKKMILLLFIITSGFILAQVAPVEGEIVINTLDEKIMFSPYYYLKPGDILYVEPRHLKSWSMSSIPTGLVLTLVSSVMTIFTFITVLQD